MKKRLYAAGVLLAAVTAVSALGGCAEIAKDTGNKAAEKAKSYLQSEVGVSGDLSTLRDSAVSYLHEELGLNNNANRLIQGTWTPADKNAGDGTWSFSGSNTCTLKNKQNNTADEGTYSVNETEKTVEIALNSWKDPVTFTFKLRQTLSDEYLDLTAEDDEYHLIKKK